MYIEKVLKLKLKPDEAELLNRCEKLLEVLLSSLHSGCLGDIEADDIAFASDVLLRLNANKELY